MKYLLCYIVGMLSLVTNAQPDIKHSIYFKDKKCVLNGEYNYYEFICPHSGGNYFATKTMNPGSSQMEDVRLYKLNAQFDTIWSKLLGGSENDRIENLQELPNGNLVLAGITSSNDGDVPYGHTYSAQEIWVVIVDTNGNILKGTTFGGSNSSLVREAIVSRDGYIYIVGETIANDYDFAHVNFGFTDQDVWTAKLDTSLNRKWIRIFSGDTDEGGFSIAEVSTNQFVVGISTIGTNAEMLGNQARGDGDVVLYSIDSNSTTIWAKRFGSSGGDDITQCVVDTTNNNIYILGVSPFDDMDITYQTGDSNYNCWILSVDVLGNIRHSKSYGCIKFPNGMAGNMRSIDAVWYNGHLWVTAITRGSGGDVELQIGNMYNDNTWIGMIDTNVNLVGKYTIRTTGMDNPIHFFKSKNQLFLNGYTASSNNFMSCDTSREVNYILNIGIAPLGIGEINNKEESIFTLYPNPANDAIVLQIVDKYINVKSRYIILGMDGKQVKAGKLKKGANTTLINIKEMARGNYSVQVELNNHIETKQFIKL